MADDAIKRHRDQAARVQQAALARDDSESAGNESIAPSSTFELELLPERSWLRRGLRAVATVVVAAAVLIAAFSATFDANGLQRLDRQSTPATSLQTEMPVTALTPLEQNSVWDAKALTHVTTTRSMVAGPIATGPIATGPGPDGASVASGEKPTADSRATADRDNGSKRAKKSRRARKRRAANRSATMVKDAGSRRDQWDPDSALPPPASTNP